MQNTTINKYLALRATTLVPLGLALLAGNLSAAAIEGTVKDANGRPLGGADVRIEAKAGGNSGKVVKTDNRGHYYYDGLAAGATYRVTLSVNGAVKASINNALTKTSGPTQLNFDLKQSAGAASAAVTKKGKHLVWMPADTGSHIGGRWVEVNDAGGNASSTAGADNVQKATGDAVRRLQMQTGGSGNVNTGGH